MSPTSPRQPGAGAGGARHHHHNHQAAACKLHRDSHGIHKAAATSPPSSSSTNSSVSSSSTTSRPAPAPAARQKQPQQQPVIIYTHSPKVIRTSPRDFMSIVQKLTGLDSPARAAAAAAARNANVHSHAAAAAAQDESSSSSSESCANAHAVHAAAPHPYADPRLMPPPAAPPAQQLDAHFVAAPDIPLFAPGPSELQLCVPTGLYDQFPLIDAAAPLGPAMNGNGGAVFSPSTVEAMRTFPDY